MPFSISTVRPVGVPSSSQLSEPRRLAIVPSSTTVHSGEATRSPMRPLKAETSLRLKSPSRPWPTASCSSTPGQPGPSTTVIVPAGASIACRLRSAWSAAACTQRRQRSPSVRKRELDPAAAAGGALLALAVLVGDAGDAQADQRLHVADDDSGRVDHQDDLLLDAEAGQDVGDARIVAARDDVDLVEQRDLLVQTDVERRAPERVEIVRRAGRRAPPPAPSTRRHRRSSAPSATPRAGCRP